MTKYVSSNTDQQTIITFDLGRYSSLHFEVQQYANSYVQDTTIDITHDGTQTFDFQQGQSTNGKPTLITSNITDYEGCLITTPPANDTIYIIKSRGVQCNVYSQTTRSGILLQDYEDGFSIDFDSSLKSITVRDSANVFCEYTGPNTYITANVLGPTLTGNALISNTAVANINAWTSYAGAQGRVGNTNIAANTANVICITAISSGQINNGLYASANTVVGRTYKLSIDAKHILANDEIVRELPVRALGYSKIRVGSAIAAEDYYSTLITENTATYETIFVATTNNAYVAFGHGVRNSRCDVTNILLQEYAPHHLYDHDKGTIIITWNAIAAGSTLIRFDNEANTHSRSIAVNSGNNVVIVEDGVEAVIGAQGAGTNKVAYSYDISNTSSNVCLNGTSNSVNVATSVGFVTVTLVNSINNYIYFPIPLETANMEVLT